MFFGSKEYSQYDRHRMNKNQIDDSLNRKFISFLNKNKSQLLDLLLVKGNNQKDDVNYLIWAREKNKFDSIVILDIKEFKSYLMPGDWTQNDTTFEYRVDGKKYLHLQMKGSGEKYSNGYHSLMFHLHDNFVDDLIKPRSELKKNL